MTDPRPTPNLPPSLYPSALPIDEVLPDICETLKTKDRLVIAAPPGAGKTTRVPLALAGLLKGFDGGGPINGKILLLEPRRVAARLAARFMAASLGEPLGQTIGLSTRVDRNVSARTRVEVITDGLFTRRLLADPELSGIGAVIFDEFHERRLNMDLGLALAIETQGALRDDLKVLIMSATLDTVSVSQAIQAPVIESAGRQYPIETRYLGRADIQRAARIDDRMADAIRASLARDTGSILAFLPGARDIHRTAERLDTLPDNVTVCPLYGAMSPAEQDAAVAPPAPETRKIVLATDLAESAITIEDVRIVIDSGLARIAEDIAGGFGSSLRTVTAARASVDQRRGRAGRTAPGICYRLWDEAATRGLSPAPTPEILSSDLSGLALALADWGEQDPARLTWIDAPPTGKLAAAHAQLTSFGALHADRTLTAAGRMMASLPLAPPLSALIAKAEPGPQRALAADLAALLGERGMGGSGTDLRTRLTGFRKDSSRRAKTLREQARRWGGKAKPGGQIGPLLAKAWPGQIAMKRPGSDGLYSLSNGRGGRLDPTDALAQETWIMVAEMVGSAKDARIVAAAPITEDIACQFGGAETHDIAEFDAATKRVRARRVERIGHITLSEYPLPKPPRSIAAKAILRAAQSDGFGAIGLGPAMETLTARIGLLNSVGCIDVADAALPDWLTRAEDWLLPVLERAAPGLPKPADALQAAEASLAWDVQDTLRKEAPLKATLPSGQSVEVNYVDARAPLVSGRAQAFYGCARHPAIGAGRIPLTVELLSPGGRPAATTQDLPAFWTAGYVDMAKDMRARYPKHDWPTDPATARPHEGRTKKRLARD